LIYEKDMTDITFSVPKELLERMKKYPEIQWDKVAKTAVTQYLEKLELADQLTAKSTFTLEDAEKMGEEVKQKMWEKHKYYLEHAQK
jgi:hypothetical protein